MRRLYFCLLFAFCLAIGAHAQQTITLGQSIRALNGPWKFHTGDNLEWSNPNFDDSQWETVDLTPKAGAYDPIGGFSGYVPGWTTKGHPGYWGYAWYRIRVRTATASGQRLALAGPPDVDDAYQVFANGVLLGSFGKFPGPGQQGQSPVVYSSQPKIFRLPQPQASPVSSPETASSTEVLAFRVWMEPATLTFEPGAGGLKSAPLLGEAGVVDAHYKLAWWELLRSEAYQPIEASLFLLLALLTGSLFFFDRSDSVYRWLTIVFLLTALDSINEILGLLTQVESGWTFVLIADVFLRPFILGGWVMVWWIWFHLRRPSWMPKAIALLTLFYMVSEVLGESFFHAVPHSISAVFHLVSLAIRLFFLLLLIVIWGIQQQGREGWLVLPAVLLVGIAQFQYDLGLLQVRDSWFPFGVEISLGQIADLTLAMVIFVLLLRRLLLSLRHQRELALDVKQAAEVQHLLIPEQLPQIPGLTIESEYRPAREVGGDFFQIIPHAIDGSVLIVLGDVTGKGLQAGMLVALIVGAIRTAVETTFDPLEILQSLNRRLCGRGQAHATCLALRIEANGHATLANAGHLPPYLNGKELPMDGALPLGMIEAAEFAQMHFDVKENDRLILLSDGVVEAQNPQGDLFGFNRIEQLLKHPITAAQLADEAQTFGQQDDILVLRIDRPQMHETNRSLLPHKETAGAPSFA